MAIELKNVHPDQVLGEEQAGTIASEIVLFMAIKKAIEEKNVPFANKLRTSQFRKDPEGMIFVEIDGSRLDLGHISIGMRELWNRVNGL